VFRGETLGTFQLDDQHILHEDIGKVLSHAMALVSYWKWGFGSSPEAPKAELVEQSTLVDLLQESRAQGVGNLENSSEHPLGQGVEASALIGVHQRPIMTKTRFSAKILKMIIGRRWTQMNADFSDEPRIRLSSHFVDTTLAIVDSVTQFLESRACCNRKVLFKVRRWPQVECLTGLPSRRRVAVP
jgi:hypothetical protein